MIRDYQDADAEQVLALNAACVPDVGPMDEAKLAAFVSWAPYFRVVEVDSRVVAMLVAMDPATPYTSPNYRWFVERLERFAYIDRIAVDASQRGQGWGPALYDDVQKWALSAGLVSMCAEVNVVPPNPRSLRFHELYGFKALDEFEPTGSPDYRVVMLARRVERPGGGRGVQGAADEPEAGAEAGAEPEPDDGPPVDGPPVDWRSRVGTAGLVVGSAMIGLDRVIFPERQKDETEQVTQEPLDKWPRLEFGDADVDQLGPDKDGYWPS